MQYPSSGSTFSTLLLLAGFSLLACEAEPRGGQGGATSGAGGSSTGSSGTGGATGQGGSPDTRGTGGSSPRGTGGSGTGGLGTSRTGTGGSGTGGATGGASARAGASGLGRGGGGGGAMGGATGRGGASGAGGTTTGTLFSECRFHFGAIDSTATASIRSEIDYFTSGWLLGVSFNHGKVCTDTAAGGNLAGKLPVMVSYIAADYVKRTHKLCDCNVTSCGSSGGRANDLCNYGAQYITQDWAAILELYKSNSNGFANCMAGRPIVFEMEPDWYQYSISNQTQPWSAAQAGTNMTALINAMKSNSALKAYFSLDLSPWIPDNGSGWYSKFDLSLFTFASTSGGGTDANNTRIRANNTMTWAGVNSVTGKPILADTGYGAAGAPTGEDANWNVAANINARMADGVVGICQYNPTSGWGSTIAGIRGQLNKPRYCP